MGRVVAGEGEEEGSDAFGRVEGWLWRFGVWDWRRREGSGGKLLLLWWLLFWRGWWARRGGRRTWWALWASRVVRRGRVRGLRGGTHFVGEGEEKDWTCLPWRDVICCMQDVLGAGRECGFLMRKVSR